MVNPSNQNPERSQAFSIAVGVGAVLFLALMIGVEVGTFDKDYPPGTCLVNKRDIGESGKLYDKFYYQILEKSQDDGRYIMKFCRWWPHVEEPTCLRDSPKIKDLVQIECPKREPSDE